MPSDSEMMMPLRQTPDRATASGGNIPTQFRAVTTRGMGHVPQRGTSGVNALQPSKHVQVVLQDGAKDAKIVIRGRLTNQGGGLGDQTSKDDPRQQADHSSPHNTSPSNSPQIPTLIVGKAHTNARGSPAGQNTHARRFVTDGNGGRYTNPLRGIDGDGR